MKEAIVHPDIHVDIIDSPIPQPDENQVLIKVVVSGSNPKDWKSPERGSPHNSGDDIAGTVHSVGSNVVGFHPGDRVAAFHVMRTANGSFAEYAISPAHTVFHIPKNTSFEEAATLPLAAMTAAIGLFVRLGLPEPWSSDTDTDPAKLPPRAGPLVIYGGASAVGAFAIQLAKHAHIGPLLVVAGKGIPFVQKLLGPAAAAAGDVVVDYRRGDEHIVAELTKAVEKTGSPLRYAFDATAEKGSYQNIAKVIQATASLSQSTPAKASSPELPHITAVLPVQEGAVPSSIRSTFMYVGAAHGDHAEFAAAWFHLFSRGLHQGWLKPHPTELVPGGLAGVEQALKNLKAGKASAVKYIFRIADTPGVSTS